MWFRRASKIGFDLDIAAFCGEAHVSHIHLVSTSARAHQEVLRLHIAMDDMLRVDILETSKELVGKHQHRLQGELTTAKIEQVLEAWS